MTVWISPQLCTEQRDVCKRPETPGSRSLGKHKHNSRHKRWNRNTQTSEDGEKSVSWSLTALLVVFITWPKVCGRPGVQTPGLLVCFSWFWLLNLTEILNTQDTRQLVFPESAESWPDPHPTPLGSTGTLTMVSCPHTSGHVSDWNSLLWAQRWAGSLFKSYF